MLRLPSFPLPPHDMIIDKSQLPADHFIKRSEELLETNRFRFQFPQRGDRGFER